MAASSSASSSHFSAAALQHIQAQLSEGIDLDDIKFRPVGGGKNAAYVPAEAAVCVALAADCAAAPRTLCYAPPPSRCASPLHKHCRAVANEIFSFNAWACEVKECKIVHLTKEDGGARWSCAYQCLMRVTVLDNGRPLCWHEDVGYGSSQQPKIDAAYEVAYKAAVTDARKRCLRLFGPALGLNVNSEAFQKAATDARKNALQAEIAAKKAATVQQQAAQQAAHQAAAAAAAAASAAAAGAAAMGASGHFGSGGAGGAAAAAPQLGWAGQPQPAAAPAAAPQLSGTKRRAEDELAGEDEDRIMHRALEEAEKRSSAAAGGGAPLPAEGSSSSSSAVKAGSGSAGGSADAAQAAKKREIEAKRLAALEKQAKKSGGGGLLLNSNP